MLSGVAVASLLVTIVAHIALPLGGSPSVLASVTNTVCKLFTY